MMKQKLQLTWSVWQESWTEAIKENPGLLILSIAAVTLRWTGLVSSALWFDESFSILAARMPLFEMIRALQLNISPPGWEIIVWFATHIVGEMDIAYRIVPFIASVLALWVFWRLTQELRFTRWQQLFGFALLALSPYQLWVAQEARLYSLLSLLYLLGILWACQGRFLGLTAVMGLMLWIHNTAFFLCASLGLLALLAHPRRWQTIFFSGAVALLAWSSWASTLFSQTQQNNPLLTPLSLDTFTFDFVFDLFASTTLWSGGPILPILLFYISLAFASIMQIVALFKRLAGKTSIELRALERWEKLVAENRSWIPAFVFWIPLTFFLVTSVLFANTLFYRTTSALLPPLMLWLAVALIPNRSTRVHWVLPSVWIGLMLWGLLIWTPNARGTNLVQVIDIIKDEWQPGDMIYHANDMTAALFSYYLPNKPQYVIDEDVLAGGKGIVELLKLDVQRGALEKIPHTRAWLVSPYFDYPSPSDERMADRRMRAYSAPCVLTGIVPYFQHAYVAVHLCLDSSSLQNASR